MEQKGCGGNGSPKEADVRDQPEALERTDASGVRWRRVYTGGGSHFQHWLEQFKEVYGAENLVVEEEDPTGFACFEQSGEPMLSIWLKIDSGRPGG